MVVSCLNIQLHYVEKHDYTSLKCLAIADLRMWSNSMRIFVENLLDK